MAGIITTYKINKRFYHLLAVAELHYEEEIRTLKYRESDKEPENLMIDLGDKQFEIPFRLFHLQWIGNMSLGYAVIKRNGQYILVIDRYKKCGEPEYFPFSDGVVVIYDVTVGKQNRNVTFKIQKE